MPCAYLISGFLGAGKTTLARQIEQATSELCFSRDEWMVRLYGPNPPAASFAEYANRVTALQQELWQAWLQQGGDVILDLNFWSRAQRQQIRNTVASLGAESVLFHVCCSDVTAWSRVEARNRQLQTLFISRATFETLRGRWESPEAEERAIKFVSGR